MRDKTGMLHSIALAAALAGIAFRGAPDPIHSVTRPASRKRFFEPAFIPNDHGPVVDTTKEGKRARRRRLAKQKAAR